MSTFIRCLWLQYIAHSIRFRSVQESLRFGLHSICMMKWLKNIQNLIFMSCSCAKPWEAWWIGSCKLAYVCVYLLHIYRYICMCMCVYIYIVHTYTYLILFAFFFAKAPRPIPSCDKSLFCENVARANAKVHSDMQSFANGTEFETFSHVQRKGQRKHWSSPIECALTKKRCVLPSENLMKHSMTHAKKALKIVWTLHIHCLIRFPIWCATFSLAAPRPLRRIFLPLSWRCKTKNSSGNLDMLRSSQVNMESDLILGPRWS